MKFAEKIKCVPAKCRTFFTPDSEIKEVLSDKKKPVDSKIRKPILGKIDFYIIKKFLGTYFFSIALIMAIATIFDFNERIDKFASSHATWHEIIFDYYLNFIPYLANLFSALFVFISVIFFTTKLADNSEIIAMRSTGMGFNRLLRPYMVSAGVIALLSFVLGAFVIPHGNVERLNFDQQYIHKKKVTTAENVQLQVDTGVVAYIQHFDNDTKTGFNFSFDKFSDKKLVSHLTASSIQYDTLAQKRYKWKIRDYEVRELHGLREKIYKGAETDSIIMMEPSDFMYSRNQQETLTSPELYEFIEKQKMRGAANLSMFEVEFYKRFASPFAAFILTVIGVSLSCQKRKGGMGLSLGIGLALSFSYIMFETVSSTFAVKAYMPPLVAAWIPNILFSIIAFILYRRAPK